MKRTITTNRAHSQNYKPLTIHLSRVCENTGITAVSPEELCEHFHDVADLAQEAFWVVTVTNTNTIINL